jgi:hypothetical protein
MRAARKLLKQFGIKIPPYNRKCGEMETKSINTIERLIAKHGIEPMVLTLRVFAETNPANRFELDRETITAVHAACRLKRWNPLGLAFLDAWDAMDLDELRRRAETSGMEMAGHPLWTMLATLIITRLSPILDPLIPKPPPKPVRVKREPKPPISVMRIRVQANVELGTQLMALRAITPGNCAFGRLVRKQFDLDQACATEAMRVARLYGRRWEITSRLSWAALVELSLSIPQLLRRELEANIIAGKRIGAPEIRRARGRHKSGRPKRADQPALRMAA